MATEPTAVPEGPKPAEAPAERGTILPALPDAVADRVAAYLSPTDVACGLRLVNRAAAARYRDAPQHRTLHASHPVPHAEFVRHCSAGGGAMRSLPLARRRHFVCLVAASGSVANMSVAGDLAGCTLNADVFAAAAEAGQLGTCAWLRAARCPGLAHVLPAAAGAGRQQVVEWLLHECGCPFTASAQRAAARGGHVTILERLLQLQPLPPGAPEALGIVEAAAHGCDLDTLQRLHSALVPAGAATPCAPARGPLLLAAAAGSPTPDWREKVAWLEAAGYAKGSCAAVEAVACDDALARLQWLVQRGYGTDGEALEAAARVGCVQALRWLLAQGLAATVDACSEAASHGRLQALQLLCAAVGEQAAPGQGLLLDAAQSGSVEAVAWVVEQMGGGGAADGAAPPAAQLDAAVALSASRSCSMQLLQWLRRRGTAWDARAFVEAAGLGSEEQLEWLAAEGCPVGAPHAPYLAACGQGNLAALRCLRRLGFELEGRVLLTALERGCSLEMLDALLHLGCPVDWDAAAAAAWFCPREVQEWVAARRRQQGHQAGGGSSDAAG